MSDHPTTISAMRDRSEILRFFAWLFSPRGLRRILILAAWTVTVIALFYGEENWRGRHAWNEYRKASEARGVPLNFSAYAPKPVPDDQNFAMTPFLEARFQANGNQAILTNDLWFRADDSITATHFDKDRGHRHFTDLAAWQMAEAALQSVSLKPLPREVHFETDKLDLGNRAAAAPAVLEGMKPDAPVFAELRAASKRPAARFPLHYDVENPSAVPLPHLASVKQVVSRLDLETCAELAAGQGDAALADENLMLALADSMKSEPFLISYLVRLSCVQIAIQPLWEGLAEHRWTDAQLQELQNRFLSYDFLTDMGPVMNGERARAMSMVDFVKVTSLDYVLSNDVLDDSAFEPGDMNDLFHKFAFWAVARLAPSGWFDQEKLNYDRLFDAQFEGVVNPVAKTVSPRHSLNNESALIGISLKKPIRSLLAHHLIAAAMLPSVGDIPRKAAQGQTVANQAAIACALERYRLANGQFPETLNQLEPHFMVKLPNDVITCAPYKYHRTGDGVFLLYSFGWNEKDDNGVPGRILFDPTNGDWVWTYPAE